MAMVRLVVDVVAGGRVRETGGQGDMPVQPKSRTNCKHDHGPHKHYGKKKNSRKMVTWSAAHSVPLVSLKLNLMLVW